MQQSNFEACPRLSQAERLSNRFFCFANTPSSVAKTLWSVCKDSLRRVRRESDSSSSTSATRRIDGVRVRINSTCQTPRVINMTNKCESAGRIAKIVINFENICLFFFIYSYNHIYMYVYMLWQYWILNKNFEVENDDLLQPQGIIKIVTQLIVEI